MIDKLHFIHEKAQQNIGRVCPLCGGYMADGIATLPFVIDGRVVVVKDVAAEICGDCGEAFMNGKVTDIVVERVRNAVKNGNELSLISMAV